MNQKRGKQPPGYLTAPHFPLAWLAHSQRFQFAPAVYGGETRGQFMSVPEKGELPQRCGCGFSSGSLRDLLGESSVPKRSTFPTEGTAAGKRPCCHWHKCQQTCSLGFVFEISRLERLSYQVTKFFLLVNYWKTPSCDH